MTIPCADKCIRIPSPFGTFYARDNNRSGFVDIGEELSITSPSGKGTIGTGEESPVIQNTLDLLGISDLQRLPLRPAAQLFEARSQALALLREHRLEDLQPLLLSTSRAAGVFGSSGQQVYVTIIQDIRQAITTLAEDICAAGVEGETGSTTNKIGQLLSVDQNIARETQLSEQSSATINTLLERAFRKDIEMSIAMVTNFPHENREGIAEAEKRVIQSLAQDLIQKGVIDRSGAQQILEDYQRRLDLLLQIASREL